MGKAVIGTYMIGIWDIGKAVIGTYMIGIWDIGQGELRTQSSELFLLNIKF